MSEDQPLPTPLSFGWYTKVVCSSALILLVSGSFAGILTGVAPDSYWAPSLTLRLQIGQAFAVVGFAMYAWSYLTLRRQLKGILGAPQTLISSGGPWGRIRHPMYLADIIWLAGFGIIAPVGIGAALWALCVFGALSQAKVEDQWMAKRFGEEHDLWRQRSWMVVPGLW